MNMGARTLGPSFPKCLIILPLLQPHYRSATLLFRELRTKFARWEGDVEDRRLRQNLGREGGENGGRENIPIEFAKKTGIIHRSYVTLRNKDGESKLVRASIRPKDGRVGMRGDWNDYWMEDDLSVGNDFGTLHVSRKGLIVPNMPKKKRMK